jgi:hypothetical protein
MKTLWRMRRRVTTKRITVRIKILNTGKRKQVLRLGQLLRVDHRKRPAVTIL